MGLKVRHKITSMYKYLLYTIKLDWAKIFMKLDFTITSPMISQDFFLMFAQVFGIDTG